MQRTVHVFSKVEGLFNLLTQRHLPVTFKNIHEKDGSLTADTLSAEQLQSLEDAEILVVDPYYITKHNLAQKLTKLKWMQSTWAGVDGIFKTLDASKPLPGYTLTRFGGCFGEHMAEFVLGQIISHERGFSKMKEKQGKCHWAQEEFAKYRLLRELQIGILGAGDIGKEVARVCKSMNMRVWGMVSRNIPEHMKCPFIDHYRTTTDIEDILKNCDYVCNILPSTPATTGLLSGNKLSTCEKKPVFINLGRGNVIDEDSVIQALNNGWISHAVLDVFEAEPLPPSSALWTHPGVTVSPHVSACSFARQVADLFEENYKRFSTNQELKYVVNWERGY